MFGKLKDKLKGALNVFSKKTEEEAVDIPEEELEKVEEVSEEVPEEKPEPVQEKIPTAEDLVKETKEKFSKPRKVEKKKVMAQDVVDDKPAKKPVKNIPKEIEKEKVVETVEETVKEEEPVIEEAKEEPVESEEKIVEEVKSEEKEEPITEEKTEEPKEESSGFFGKVKSFFGKKDEEVEETKEGVDKELQKESTEEKPAAESKEVTKSEETAEEIKEEKTEEPEAVEEVKEEEPEKKGFFGKVKESLTTKKITADKFESLFWELEVVLLENNVSVEVIEKIKEDLKEELVDKPLPRDVLGKINDTLQKTLNDILEFETVDLLKNIEAKEGPYVVALFGINGAGKTTSIAKLTHYLKENGKSVVLAACDTFRAAAIQQLGEHAERLDVKMIKHDYGSDSAAVAYDAIKYAEKNNVDVVLIDTAGRLHSNTNLMAELEKIIRVTNPDLKIFVGESITGNDCVEQARKFNELVQMDGAILTKADVDEKGGAPLSISYVIGKPILFLGVGQEYKDLEKFDKEKMLTRLGF